MNIDNRRMNEILINYFINFFDRFQLDFINCVIKLWKDYDPINITNKGYLDFLNQTGKHQEYKNIDMVKTLLEKEKFLNLVNLCNIDIGRILNDLIIGKNNSFYEIFSKTCVFDTLDYFFKHIFAFLDFFREFGAYEPFINIVEFDELYVELKRLHSYIVSSSSIVDYYCCLECSRNGVFENGN